MNNQDEVALRIMRPDISEMHELMFEYGNSGWRHQMSWDVISRSPRTHEFLLSHGWSLADYKRECEITCSNHGRFDWLASVFRYAR